MHDADPTSATSIIDEARATARDLPTVSAIIPTYRRPALLARAIRSVLAQDYQHLECIVVDNEPNGENRAVAERLGVRYLVAERKGKCEAFNAGLAQSTGKYVSMLDDDDEWLPQKLSMEVGLLDAMPGLDGLVCGRMLVNSLGWRRPERNYSGKLTEFGVADYLRRRVKIGPASILRRDALLAVGGLNSACQALEDLDVHVRLLTSGFHIALLEVPLYVVHGDVQVSFTRVAGYSVNHLEAACDIIERASESRGGKALLSPAEWAAIRRAWVFEATTRSDFLRSAGMGRAIREVARLREHCGLLQSTFWCAMVPPTMLARWLGDMTHRTARSVVAAVLNARRRSVDQ